MFQKIASTYRRELLVCLFLFLATFAVFWQVNHFNFINYDDEDYVTENSHIKDGITKEGFRWAFVSMHAANWHPLTWLSHMLDCQLFGLNAGMHHLVNVLFHIANSILLFLVLYRMTKGLWQSAFVAGLFALHPLHVESVAWVSERKDVLSTFFWMLTMGAYAYYVEHPVFKRYLFVFLFFVLGLLSKPMLVTLPFVLLLLDFWPLKRLRIQTTPVIRDKQSEIPLNSHVKKKEQKKRAIKTEPAKKKEASEYPPPTSVLFEKVPFFIISIVSSVLTYMAQGGAVGSMQSYPLPVRIANALMAYCAYIWKAIWPSGLAVLYPHSGMAPTWAILGAAVCLGITTFLITKTIKNYPYLTMGWLWFLGTLVPVIGLVQVGVQSMADRYTYVPLTGIFIMVSWGVPELLQKWRHYNIVPAILACVTLLILSFITWTQTKYWQNSMTLYEHTLAVTTNNALIMNNMGKVLEDKGRLDKALKYYNQAIDVNPRLYIAYENRGNVKAKTTDYKGAIADYEEALKIKPAHSDGHYNLANALAHEGKMVEAETRMREAVRLKPGSPEYHNNLGYILALQGKEDDAIDHFREAIRLNSYLADAYNNLGSALLHQRKLDEAISSYRQALRLKPDYALARENLTNALAERRRRQ